MSTLHYQPLWLSLRNTNQLSAPDSLTLPLYFSLPLTPSHFLFLSLSLCLSLVDRKQVLHHHFNSGVGVQVAFFSLLEMHGASSEEPAQSEGSGVWILMTSTRRNWGEEVWWESALNLSLSPSACLSHTYMDPCMQLVCVYRICLPLIRIN